MKNKVINATIPTDIDKGSQNALTQILDRAIEGAQERALEAICDGNFRGANGGVMTAQRQLEALIRAIEGMNKSNIRDHFAVELISNANATIEDIDATILNDEPSLNICTDDFGKASTTTSTGAKIRSLGEETTSSEDSDIAPLDDSITKSSEDSDIAPLDDSITEPSEVDTEDKSKSSDNSALDAKTSYSSNIPTPSIEEPSPETESSSEKVPLWIKNNAGWWAEKQIKDSDFILGIQYLIEEDVIEIPSISEQTSQKAGDSVPEWVRNNADWWSEDLISEKEFLDAIKYLVNEGIIQITN
jgi:hypothetical protein